MQENTDALLGAYNTDLGRYKLETNLPEMSPIVSGAVLAANSLEDWTNPERPKVKDPVRATWSTTIHKAPKGILVLQKTRSGQLILKDVFTQLAVYEILFGRCGNSGCKSIFLGLSAQPDLHDAYRRVVFGQIFI